MDDFDQLAGGMTEDGQAVEGKSTFDRIRCEFEDRRLARASAKRENPNGGANGHDAPLARGLEGELRQAQRQVDDLAMLAGKLARALRKAEPESALSKAAVEYLHRNGFALPLRHEG